jgi:hypothetical protein
MGRRRAAAAPLATDERVVQPDAPACSMRGGAADASKAADIVTAAAEAAAPPAEGRCSQSCSKTCASSKGGADGFDTSG